MHETIESVAARLDANHELLLEQRGDVKALLAAHVITQTQLATLDQRVKHLEGLRGWFGGVLGVLAAAVAGKYLPHG